MKARNSPFNFQTSSATSIGGCKKSCRNFACIEHFLDR